MSLDGATVARVARLARIAISDEERERLAGELSGILDWVEQLDEVDTEGVEPITCAVAATPKPREDAVTEGGVAEDIVKNAPKSAQGFFVVPKTVE